MTQRNYLLLFLILSLFSLNTAALERYATSSVLSKGKWMKVRIDESGIHKLTFSELKDMGFADPSKVAVYGYGGAPLAEDFSQPYTDDLPQVPSYRGADFLLFHAQGTLQWTFDSRENLFLHKHNPYSVHGYYFLSDALPIIEVEKANAPSKTKDASLAITTFDDHFLHEKDLVSPNLSGRELFGESFVGKPSQDFPFSIPGITADFGLVTLRFISKTLTSRGTVALSIDGKKIIEKSIPQSTNSGNGVYQKAVPILETKLWTGDKKEKTNVKITYGQSGHTNVHLDYIRLQVKRTLKLYGSSTAFRSLQSIDNVSTFTIANTNEQTIVWDITDKTRPLAMETKHNAGVSTFNIPAGTLREFVAFDPNASFPKPKVVGKVANQNLHALPQTNMLIIAPTAFLPEAERLAEAHRSHDKLKVTVVDAAHVLNEYASGTPDATAYRRFVKMFYDRAAGSAAQNTAANIQYLLFFGDTSYDNRKLTAAWRNTDYTNLLLSFQSQESLGIHSFTTDDYFGFLDDNEGMRLASDKMDIGIGRFPVRTREEASAAVDKVIGYMQNKQLGIWKNKTYFVADDGSNSDGYTTDHMAQSNQLAEYMEQNHPAFVNKKLFLDAFKKDVSTGSGRYPDVELAIQKGLKEGMLLINYTGHGNTEFWSDEQIMTQNQIKQAPYTCLPVWITASCDFTRFDDSKTSAGEDVFLNKKSGGIGLFTTSRVVFSGPNFHINEQLIANLFKRHNGERLTLGEIMKETKLSLGSDANKLNFVLIGDPALTLAYPEYSIKVTEINGKPLTGEAVRFQALERITVSGEVHHPDGTLAKEFNGMLQSMILDSKQTISTLDNNKRGKKFQFTDYPNLLFAGNETIKEGRFTYSFTVPKDISYSNDFGKMNLYASDESGGHEAQGAYLNFKVGGTSPESEKDTVGPAIRLLYLNDTTFTDGTVVNETPLFVAKLWDQSGVNISGGSIGHDMMLMIDNKATHNYNLNSYYQSTNNKEGEGQVAFSIPTLDEGLHTAEFKVWDVLNNSTTQTFTFEVSKTAKPILSELYATPIPARESVDFYLHHNRPETTLDITIEVFDMTGQLQWQQKAQGTSGVDKALVATWNLTNGAGGRVRPGIYLYRARIQTAHSSEATLTKKLIVLGQ